jgi:hypothetical protein
MIGLTLVSHLFWIGKEYWKIGWLSSIDMSSGLFTRTSHPPWARLNSVMTGTVYRFRPLTLSHTTPGVISSNRRKMAASKGPR